MKRALLVVLVVLGATLFAVDARAGEPPLAAKRGPVVWKDEWPHFSPWEGATTLAATAVGFVMERKVSEPTGPNFDHEVPLLDPGLRFLLRGRTKKLQDVSGIYSDLGFRMMAFFPYIVDAGVFALAVHRSPEVAAQIALIDIQALTLSGATQFIAARAFGRQRPYVQDCNDSGETFTRECGGSNDWKSFFSGHSAGAFTSAGLVCVHHQHIPLYGGGPIEAWACTWALTVAAATGVLRIVSDNHYATDVLAGAGVGWFYGYVMPKLLHYKGGRLNPSKAALYIPSILPYQDGAMVSFGRAF